MFPGFHQTHLLRDENFLDVFNTTRSTVRDGNSDVSIEDIPSKISASYVVDYNILHVDTIIKKKLSQEKYTLIPGLKIRRKNLEDTSMKEQTYIKRSMTLECINNIDRDIEDITSGKKLETYCTRVQSVLETYKRCSGKIKIISFEMVDSSNEERDEHFNERVRCIEEYLDIASEYMNIDVIRKSIPQSNNCRGCKASLTGIATTDEGTIRCEECGTEQNLIIVAKMCKDNDRINVCSSDDESIDNFLRALTRYQGLQQDKPDDSVYSELDEYFTKYDRKTGEQVRKLPLESNGRRGDTNHKMLWNALSQIDRSEYYEHANLIGSVYWGWSLPCVMHLRDNIIDKYNKTQMVFYQIPPEERGRNSSLGTQFRLWRHLQLEGHPCTMDEFKIAENPESLRTHNKLWRMMCDGCSDPSITYIP